MPVNVGLKGQLVYQFPAIREGVRGTSLYSQAMKCREEVCEVAQELDLMTAEDWGNVEKAAGAIQGAAFEAVNLLHAAETLCRMLEAEGADMDAAKAATVEANRERGYYG